jgi:hypothetical protein
MILRILEWGLWENNFELDENWKIKVVKVNKYINFFSIGWNGIWKKKKFWNS